MTSKDNANYFIWFFSISFLYTIISMAAAREIIIPSIFPLALDRDMPGDPVYFKTITMEAAAKFARMASQRLIHIQMDKELRG
jgi:hypothetical protein